MRQGHGLRRVTGIQLVCDLYNPPYVGWEWGGRTVLIETCATTLHTRNPLEHWCGVFGGELSRIHVL
jgi:hypothetical protein